MPAKFAPTRGDFVKLKNSISAAQSGRDLLDQKRQVLMFELASRTDAAKKIQAEAAEVFREAYDALQRATISLGIEVVEDIVQSVPEIQDLTVRFHSVMGVEVPEIEPPAELPAKPCCSFLGSSGAADEAYAKFRRVSALLAKLAETEAGICRLAAQMKKSHRRINSLDKIVIPSELEQLKFISDALEESEREDFTRMKSAQKLSVQRKQQ